MQIVTDSETFEKLMDDRNIVVTTLHIPDENVSLWKSLNNFDHLNTQLKDIEGLYLVCTRIREKKISSYHFFTNDIKLAYRINYMLGELMDRNIQVNLSDCPPDSISVGTKQDMVLDKINPHCTLIGR